MGWEASMTAGVATGTSEPPVQTAPVRVGTKVYAFDCRKPTWRVTCACGKSYVRIGTRKQMAAWTRCDACARKAAGRTRRNRGAEAEEILAERGPLSARGADACPQAPAGVASSAPGAAAGGRRGR